MQRYDSGRYQVYSMTTTKAKRCAKQTARDISGRADFVVWCCLVGTGRLATSYTTNHNAHGKDKKP